jgi:hypothetical protein
MDGCTVSLGIWNPMVPPSYQSVEAKLQLDIWDGGVPQ